MRGKSDSCCLLYSKFCHFSLIPVYSPGAANLLARPVYSTAGLPDGEKTGRRAVAGCGYKYTGGLKVLKGIMLLIDLLICSEPFARRRPFARQTV